jgi:spore germination cell wall hydrolase CwlJ-like protein
LQKRRPEQRPELFDCHELTETRARRRGGFLEYVPFVISGILLIAAFAFAGSYMGQNAAARNLSPTEDALDFATPVANIIAKGSLLPQGENFDIVSLKISEKQTVASFGKGDFLDADPNALMVITPASVDLSGKSDVAATITPAIQRLAIAPSPAKIEKSFKLKRGEKQAVVAQRRIRLAEENCLARAIYFEARSESQLGQLAVAKVILNRTRDPDYPKTICGVVYQGSNRRNSCQFSFACDGLPDDVKQPGAWVNAKQVAQKAMNGSKSMQSMSTATNYHADYVKPKWASSMKRLVKIGRHIFYSDS